MLDEPPSVRAAPCPPPLQPDSWKGPWAGYAGEGDAKVPPLLRGALTEAQKKLCVCSRGW